MDTVPPANKRRLNRRRFLTSATVLGASSLLRLGQADAAEPPPEVKRIRLTHAPSICLAPQLLAEELLKLEGFSEVEYVELKVNKQVSEVASGRVDMAQTATTEVIPAIDAVEPVVVIAGIHAGCFEFFVDKRIGRITDLKGKKVVIGALGSAEHVYVSSIAAYVGINRKPTSIGSLHTRAPTPCVCSPRVRPTLSSLFRRNPRNSGPRESVA